jgi:hypothetical protein
MFCHARFYVKVWQLVNEVSEEITAYVLRLAAGGEIEFLSAEPLPNL